VSGHSKTERELNEISELLKTKYDTVDIQTTTENLSAEDISRENVGLYDIFVVVGGDGTFNETIRGIVGREDKPKIGYIPSGTVNDFALSNNIPFDHKEAIDVVLNGTPTQKSAMFLNGIPACYLAAAGMFTCVSYTANQKTKRKLGKLAYYLEVIFKDKGRHGERLKITVDGEKHEGYFTFVAGLNNQYVGGLRVSREPLVNNEEFYFVMAKKKKGFFGTIASLLAMTKTYIKKIENVPVSKRIVIKKVKSVSIKSLSNTNWNIDGEKGPCGDAEITYGQSQFEVFLPNS
jgi:diacylglycerol kinase (ATP)